MSVPSCLTSSSLKFILASSSDLFEEMKDGVIPDGDFRTGTCGAEVTVGDFAVAEEEVRTGGLATGAVGSEIEDFLTDAVPDWLLDFEVCPVGCFVSSLAIGAVFRLDDNPNVVTSFGLGVGAGAGVGLSKYGGRGGVYLVAEADVVCLDSWVMLRVDFVAGTWVGLGTGVGAGSVLGTAASSGVELVVGEGEVSEGGVEMDGGMGVELGIGLIIGAVVELAIVSGLIAGLDLGDRSGLAGQVVDLVGGLDVGLGAGSVMEADVGVGVTGIVVAVA